MINVMIVDDDNFFRSMFSNLINWREHGCSLVYQAENGQQAIEYLNKERVDLVFTDMNMPLVDGIQLIDYISNYKPDVKYVSLSSYDDFSYVRESLTHGAIDYILKHMLTKNDLERVINKFKEDYSFTSHHITSAYSSSESSRSSFLFGLLEGVYSSSTNIPSLLKAVSLPDINKNILLFYLHIEDIENILLKYNKLNKDTQFIKTIISIMQSILDRLGRGVVFKNECNDNIFALLSADGLEDVHFAEQTAQLYTNQVSNSLKTYLNINADMIAAPVCRDIKNIHYSYLYILKKLKQPLPDSQKKQNGQTPPPQFFERELKHNLQIEDFGPLKENILYYYNEGRKNVLSLAGFAELTTALFNAFISIDSSMKTKLYEGYKIKPKDIKKIMSFGSDLQMQDYILEVFKKLQIAIEKKDTEKYSSIVYSALRMIHKQHFNSSLSLNLIAEEIHVNPSYLSRIFKTEKGIGLMDYINMYRIKRSADLLLTTDLTVKEIAEKSGFENYNYFFRVFKKYTNSTPNDFKSTN